MLNDLYAFIPVKHNYQIPEESVLLSLPKFKTKPPTVGSGRAFSSQFYKAYVEVGVPSFLVSDMGAMRS